MVDVTDRYVEDALNGLAAVDSQAQSPLDTQVGGGHYKDFKIQPVEYITANDIPYLEGNVIKYTTRHKLKNGKEDVLKAIHYLELILELRYGEKRG